MDTKTFSGESNLISAPPLKGKLKLLNSYISKGAFGEFVKHVFWLSENCQSSYVCFANVHMLVEAYYDKKFNEILNKADLATPDGGPLSQLMRMLYDQQQDRVAGMDLLPRLLEEASLRKKSVYFYGSTNEVLNAVVIKAKKEHPDLIIAGYFSPPFRKLSPSEDMEIINKINEAEPDLLFVALGCPKQEQWMADHKGKINTCMLGVGQAFMTFAGLEKRLPVWARNLSLEWTYRLFLEPRRLWKRYLFTNTTFLYLIMKLLLQKTIKGNKMESI